MRAIVVQPGPSYSVQDVFNGWARGLEQNGVEVARFSLNERLALYTGAHMLRDDEYVRALDTDAAIRLTLNGLEAGCYEIDPDVVVLIAGFFTNEQVLDTIRRHGTKVVIVHTESPYEDDRQLATAHLADLNIVNDPTNLDRFQAVAPAIYRPHSYDPAVHRPLPATRGMESEFLFVGTGYPSRIEFLERVDWSGIDVALGGHWRGATAESPLAPFLIDAPADCMDNTEAVRWYGSTLTSANLYRTESNRPELSPGWAMGPREVELAACRTWFARNPRGEGDDLFPMLPTFTEPDELGEQVRWALAHPDEREEAALKASEAVADRTFANSVAEALRLL